jgi:hypothetical protein
MLISCADSDEAVHYAEKFFKNIITKKNHEAAKMIDPKATIYVNRFKFIQGIQHHRTYGKLKSMGGGFETRSVNTVSTIGLTKIQFTLKLNYDSSAVFAEIEVIDRGNGYKLNKLNI